MKVSKVFALTVCVALVACAGHAGDTKSASSNSSLSPQFKASVVYTITYEISRFEVDVVDSAKVIRVETIGGIPFLVIQKAGFSAADREGFIRMDAVRAILPSKHIVPVRTVVND